MSEFKYVMFEVVLDKNSQITWQVPIIFPDKLVHLFVAESMKASMSRQHWPGASIKPVRAGMIGELIVSGCGGESETLGLRGDSSDDKVINLYPYQHGVKT